jgi:hypothetical protein
MGAGSSCSCALATVVAGGRTSRWTESHSSPEFDMYYCFDDPLLSCKDVHLEHGR